MGASLVRIPDGQRSNVGECGDQPLAGDLASDRRDEKFWRNEHFPARGEGCSVHRRTLGPDNLASQAAAFSSMPPHFPYRTRRTIKPAQMDGARAVPMNCCAKFSRTRIGLPRTGSRNRGGFTFSSPRRAVGSPTGSSPCMTSSLFPPTESRTSAPSSGQRHGRRRS